MMQPLTLGLMAGLTLATPLVPRTRQQGLDGIAKSSGMLYFGTAADIPGTNEVRDPAYLAAFTSLHDFGQATPANAMKWMFTEPQQNVFDFSQGDQFLSVAAGKIHRCHALVWHQQAPDWVTNGVWTKETLLAAIDNHARKTVAHFGDACYAWDVVNEALLDDGTYRDSLYYNVTGTEYITTAFKAAQETVEQLGLKTKLYYNDYNIENPGVKATAAQGIVKMLQGQGVRIDGVGLQSHFIVGSSPSQDQQITNMRSFEALGVEVAITELDIRTTVPVTDAAKKQQKVDYRDTAGACRLVKACVGITLWDFVDTYSWIPGVFAGQGYGDPWYQPGGENTTLVAKIAYEGIAQGLRG